jgi:UDP-glucose/GDP-mannose dehydrogenase family, NAD binding domain
VQFASIQYRVHKFTNGFVRVGVAQNTSFKSMTAHEKAVQRISIVGTGYVGLSTAVCFVSRGYDVSPLRATKIRRASSILSEPPFTNQDWMKRCELASNRDAYALRLIVLKQCVKLRSHFSP